MQHIKYLFLVAAFFGASSLAAPAVIPGVDFTPRSVGSPAFGKSPALLKAHTTMSLTLKAPRDTTWLRAVFPEKRQDNANGGGIAGRSARDNANGGGIVGTRSPQDNANGGGIAGRSVLHNADGGSIPGKRLAVSSK